MKKFFAEIILILGLLSACAGSSFAAAWVNFPTSWDIGQAFAVSITSNVDYSKPVVTWKGRSISLNVEQGGAGKISYGLLGSDVRNTKPGDYEILFEFEQGGKKYKASGNIMLKERQYPQEKLTVSPKMVNPPKKELKRIQAESKAIGAALRTMTTARRWTTPPQPPLSNITLTSHYGFQRVYNGVPRSGHNGADIRAATGTKVLAPFAGTVILTGFHYYAGGSVYIDSGNGVITAFFHLNEINVKKGDKVAKGQVVARSGSTGRVTGPHLHYSLILGGQFVDPIPLLSTSITQMLKKGTQSQVNSL
ncbi:MAG: M23 family metallopeptidase [Synergistaceae bacterium]|nr:M23 family metallopeptidase [Synergistaceae bacterium]MBR0093668.1 M23 family metallopeptidase [Synergistaceae bacterium]